jgi:hypothetical protein
MPRQEIRVAVGSASMARSTVWKSFLQKNDVYYPELYVWFGCQSRSARRRELLFLAYQRLGTEELWPTQFRSSHREVADATAYRICQQCTFTAFAFLKPN